MEGACSIAHRRAGEIPEPIKTINRLPSLFTSVGLVHISILCEVVLFLSTCRSLNLHVPLDRAYSHNQGCLSASLPSPLPFPLHPYIHVLMRDEKEGRTKHVYLAKAQLLQLDLEIAHHAYTDSTTLVLGRKQDTHAHKSTSLIPRHTPLILNFTGAQYTHYPPPSQKDSLASRKAHPVVSVMALRVRGSHATTAARPAARCGRCCRHDSAPGPSSRCSKGSGPLICHGACLNNYTFTADIGPLCLALFRFAAPVWRIDAVN